MLAQSSMVALLLLACGGSPAGPGTPPPAPPPPPVAGAMRVLMVGNSLTSTGDVPYLVAEMAAQAGEPRPVVHSVTYANFSLEDHWQGGGARNLLRTGAYDVLVMQQGPSTAPASADHLLEWSGRWADEARGVGTRPALYAVWPPDGGDLNAGITHYTNAAAAKGAALFPVSHAWRIAWQATPAPALYGPDRFHQGPDGAWLAALVICAMLFDRPVADFPNILPNQISPAMAATLRTAASQAVAQFGRPGN